MIFIGVPTAGAIDYRLVSWLIRLGKENQVYITSMVGTEVSQNVIVEEFLKTDCTHLLLIETDQVPLADPLELIRHDKDIVSMPTIIDMGENELHWAVYDDYDKSSHVCQGRLERGTGLEQVHAVSTGCILIRREVLENVKNPFTPRRTDGDRRVTTGDILFCERAQEAGYEVWADWDRVCKHYKTINLLTI